MSRKQPEHKTEYDLLVTKIINTHRVTRKKSLEWLALELDMSDNTLTKTLKGLRPFTPFEVATINRLFGVDVLKEANDAYSQTTA